MVSNDAGTGTEAVQSGPSAEDELARLAEEKAAADEARDALVFGELGQIADCDSLKYNLAELGKSIAALAPEQGCVEPTLLRLSLPNGGVGQRLCRQGSVDRDGNQEIP